MSRARPFLVALTLALLAACSSAPYVAAPSDPEILLVRAPAEAFEPERDEISLLAAYYGTSTSLAPAIETLVSAAELRDLLEAEGFKVFAFSGNLGDTATGLPGNLARGRPLLVLVDWGGGPRWLLVVGWDGGRRLALIQDGRGAIHAIELPELERIWTPTKSLTILAVPRGMNQGTTP
ncbi:MAG: hypothetical protein H6807_00960 [Planctomycetes bacterium]|nr:hypothetical protein [Planctomycetota bacterium]